MTTQPLYIRMHPADNVAIVANDGGLPAGTVFADGLTLVDKVPQGHKVALADLAEGDVVRLQFSGSCKSCPSSSVTLELTVEDAVRAAAPEISAIEVIAAAEDPVANIGTVIPADSLMSRMHSTGRHSTTWHP